VGCVYIAENKVNGKCYVGKTVFTMERRKHEHEMEAVGRGGHYFQKALRKYGFDSFDWYVLVVNDDEDVLNELERRWIKRKRAMVPSGYNLTDGGDNGRHTEETKAKIGKANLGNKYCEGRVLSSETRKKMSKVAMGRPAWNKGIPSGAKTVPEGCTFKGRKHSPEEVARCSRFAKQRLRDARGCFLPILGEGG